MNFRIPHPAGFTRQQTLVLIFVIGQSTIFVWPVCDCTQSTFNPWVSVWCMNLTSPMLFSCSSFSWLTCHHCILVYLMGACILLYLDDDSRERKKINKACSGCVSVLPSVCVGKCLRWVCGGKWMSSWFGSACFWDGKLSPFAKCLCITFLFLSLIIHLLPFSSLFFLFPHLFFSPFYEISLFNLFWHSFLISPFSSPFIPTTPFPQVPDKAGAAAEAEASPCWRAAAVETAAGPGGGGGP